MSNHSLAHTDDGSLLELARIDYVDSLRLSVGLSRAAQELVGQGQRVTPDDVAAVRNIVGALAVVLPHDEAHWTVAALRSVLKLTLNATDGLRPEMSLADLREALKDDASVGGHA